MSVGTLSSQIRCINSNWKRIIDGSILKLVVCRWDITLYLHNWFLQFSVTEHYRGTEIGNLQFLPGVFFFYDLSPIKVGFAAYQFRRYYLINLDTYLDHFWAWAFYSFLGLIAIFFFIQVTFTEEHISFLHFLTNVCAIVGGNY